jgi:hypothetical protein
LLESGAYSLSACMTSTLLSFCWKPDLELSAAKDWFELSLSFFCDATNGRCHERLFAINDHRTLMKS